MCEFSGSTQLQALRITIQLMKLLVDGVKYSGKNINNPSKSLEHSINLETALKHYWDEQGQI